jgi:hypothetical protein
VRFLVLVLAAAAIGAGSVGAIRALLLQQSAFMVAAVRTLTDHAAQFPLSGLNPIRAAYDGVAAKITSPDPNAFKFPTSPPIVAGEPLKLKPLDLGPFGGGANVQYRRRDADWHPSAR